MDETGADDAPSRRRAPGMTPERRREMIIASALPLVAEHGAAVTTSRIARAAGIGEATIFRVFADKDELLDACIAEVLRPEGVLDALAAIPLDQPLADRLVEAASSLEAHLGRIRDVVGGLHARGARPLRRRAFAELFGALLAAAPTGSSSSSGCAAPAAP